MASIYDNVGTDCLLIMGFSIVASMEGLVGLNLLLERVPAPLIFCASTFSNILFIVQIFLSMQNDTSQVLADKWLQLFVNVTADIDCFSMYHTLHIGL